MGNMFIKKKNEKHYTNIATTMRKLLLCFFIHFLYRSLLVRPSFFIPFPATFCFVVVLKLWLFEETFTHNLSYCCIISNEKPRNSWVIIFYNPLFIRAVFSTPHSSFVEGKKLLKFVGYNFYFSYFFRSF